jgi:hypothetical protein
MKKLFLSLVVLMICGFASAQNSATESKELYKETKAEKFLRESSLYREDTYIKLKEDGITAYVKVATNLITNQKIGYCYFETEADKGALFLTGGVAGAPEPLGYLDMEEIDDMILALNKILEDTKLKKDVKSYSISFTTESGINVYYDTIEKKVFYGKKWNYTNQYGVERTYTLWSPPASLRSLSKTVLMLEKAKKVINDNL